MAKIEASTVVPAPAGSGDPYRLFTPEDDVPEWAAVQMGAHLFADGAHPFPDSDYPGKPEPVTPAKASPKPAPAA